MLVEGGAKLGENAVNIGFCRGGKGSADKLLDTELGMKWHGALYGIKQSQFGIYRKIRRCSASGVREPRDNQIMMTCPYCNQNTGIGTAAIFDTILMSRKRCERCGREFLIVNDVPMTQEQYDQIHHSDRT